MYLYKNLLLHLLLISTINCISQVQETAESTEIRLRYNKNDTVRVNNLNNTAAKIYHTDSHEAITLLKKSESLANDLHYAKGKAYCYLLLSRIYGLNKEYEKALDYASEGSALANKNNLPVYKKDFFLLLSELQYDKNEAKPDTTVAEQVRDMTAAIKYKYFLKDSLDKSEKKAGELKEEVAFKDTQLRLTRLERYIWRIAIVAMFILLAFIYTQFKIRKVKLENKQLLTEHKLLRSQMNPHFIFNSVQNIRNLISHKKDTEAIDYLNKFSRLTRQILESSNENYTSIAEELELIDNYITLQQLLYSKSFDYSVTIDDAIETDSLFIPPMLTQPFIENAIKHGLGNRTANGLVNLRFYLKEGKLFFEIIDNGSGFSTGKKESNHKSMAMSITQKRLAYYTKHKKIEIKTENIINDKIICGARVAFEIPYIYEN